LVESGTTGSAILILFWPMLPPQERRDLAGRFDPPGPALQGAARYGLRHLAQCR
jgi:hypothetical protein